MSNVVQLELFVHVHQPKELFLVQFLFFVFSLLVSSFVWSLNFIDEALLRPLYISIDPFTGHWAVKTLACISPNAIPPFWTASFQLLKTEGYQKTGSF